MSNPNQTQLNKLVKKITHSAINFGGSICFCPKKGYVDSGGGLYLTTRITFIFSVSHNLFVIYNLLT